MEKKVQAGYKYGVLRPEEPLQLEGMQQVTLTITRIDDDLAGYSTPEKWAGAPCDPITCDDVRQAQSKISESLCDAVMARRQARQCPDYFLDRGALEKL